MHLVFLSCVFVLLPSVALHKNLFGSPCFYYVFLKIYLCCVTKFKPVSFENCHLRQRYVFLQMASFTHVIVDAEGWAHSSALHTGHFPRLLWQMLRAFDYTEPPQYSGHESSLLGTERCQMIVKIPACPARLEWDSW